MATVKRLVLDADVLLQLVGFLHGDDVVPEDARVVGGAVRIRENSHGEDVARLTMIVASAHFPNAMDDEIPRMVVGNLDEDRAQALAGIIQAARKGVEEIARRAARDVIESRVVDSDGKTREDQGGEG